jgi:hypothetical protein
MRPLYSFRSYLSIKEPTDPARIRPLLFAHVANILNTPDLGISWFDLVRNPRQSRRRFVRMRKFVEIEKLDPGSALRFAFTNEITGKNVSLTVPSGTESCSLNLASLCDIRVQCKTEASR